MSYIFEALQRAEAERSGVELDAFDVPTELLEMAESVVKAQTTASVIVSAERTTEQELFPPEIKSRIENPTAQTNPLEQFESLPVSLLPYSKLVSAVEKDGLAAEKFRFLAVRLRHLQQRRSLKKLLITSTIPSEGKSMVAANLACTLGNKRQQRTVLLEGDLRRPTLQRQLGMGVVPGLSDYLQGSPDAKLPIYRLEALGLWVVPAGSIPPNPLELLQNGRLSLLVDQLCAWFDWVVIDSPPVLPLGDTSVWSRLADGIMLVTRQGTTDKEQLKRGLEAIEQSKLIGALVNSSSNAAHGAYYQHYGSPVPPPAGTPKNETKLQ